MTIERAVDDVEEVCGTWFPSLGGLLGGAIRRDSARRQEMKENDKPSCIDDGPTTEIIS